jgi:Ca-activated chloride channel family protein
VTRRSLGAAFALVVAALLAPAVSGQGPRAGPPAFSAAVELVRLDVSVLRTDGRIVTNLDESDFEIHEDGAPQAPTLFVHRELPISLTLLLDSSASIADRLPLSKAAAAGFLEALRAQDDASVVAFDDRVRTLQSPTSDRAALRSAVEGISAGGSTGLYNALYAVLKTLPPGSRDTELRRRAIVLLSDGEDTSSLIWEEQVVELARHGEATIVVIDLRPRDAANRSARLLRLLSHESGGEVYNPDSIRDLDAVYSRIGEDLKSRYTIGYVSSNPSHDGRWRRIDVRVRGRGNLRVRHRTGYYSVN